MLDDFWKPSTSLKTCWMTLFQAWRQVKTTTEHKNMFDETFHVWWLVITVIKLKNMFANDFSNLVTSKNHHRARKRYWLHCYKLDDKWKPSPRSKTFLLTLFLAWRQVQTITEIKNVFDDTFSSLMTSKNRHRSRKRIWTHFFKLERSIYRPRVETRFYYTFSSLVTSKNHHHARKNLFNDTISSLKNGDNHHRTRKRVRWHF